MINNISRSQGRIQGGGQGWPWQPQMEGHPFSILELFLFKFKFGPPYNYIQANIAIIKELTNCLKSVAGDYKLHSVIMSYAACNPHLSHALTINIAREKHLLPPAAAR